MIVELGDVISKTKGITPVINILDQWHLTKTF
jgi:hypothetical protein